MPTTVLSSKGQIIIPSPIRRAYGWHPGQKFETVDTGEGILLKPVSPFPPTELKDVSGCLQYHGPAKTIQEMNEAIARAAGELLHDRG